MLCFNDFIDREITCQKAEIELKMKELLLDSNHTAYFYDYVIPQGVDKADCFQIDNIDYAELYINDIYSCSVDNDLEIVPCATYSIFTIRMYFNCSKVPYIIPETITIRYNAHRFNHDFKHQIRSIPFRTNSHMYIDEAVEPL